MQMSKVFLVTVDWEYGSRGGLSRRRQRRIRWWLRLLVAAVALSGALWCTERVSGSYERTLAFQQAAPCPGGATSHPGDLCVGRESAVVESRHESESCTTDSNGLRSCSTTYTLTLRRPDPGRTHEIGVGHDLYQRTRVGDRAELRVWQGDLVAMSLRGEETTYAPPSQHFMRLMTGVALLLLGLGVWALVSGTVDLEEPSAPVAWTGLVLTLPWLIDAILLGASTKQWVITGVLVAVGAVWLLVGLWREFWESRLGSFFRTR
ncbi:hypothetical protein [Streptomyces sp. NPDC051561]|uniref:hypothetical protein n=1 Tax=Streptomyces sp. NPDC051561 TaxID=3365658 RepID=UPI0037B9E663